MVMKKIEILGIGLLGGLLPVLAFYTINSFSDYHGYHEVKADTNYFVEASQSPYIQDQSNLQLPDLTIASERSINSVVHITAKIPRQVQRDPFFELFYGPQQPNQQFAFGAGSGVILNTEGYIVTNNHVIDKAVSVEVTLNNNLKYAAKVIGVDPNTDLAVLKIDAKNLIPVVVGNSDDVKIGEWVLAVGNPFDLTSTVTAGIVSAKSRNINIINSKSRRDSFPIESFIQTDAAVNPGNSGGALVNVRGELVGINTAIASNTGSYAGYSFAIPVNLMRKVVKDIIEFGSVQRGFLGIRITNVTQEIMDSEKLQDTRGVYVTEILPGGAAEKAGIQLGEVILSVDNKELTSSSELLEEIGKGSPGQKMLLTVRGKNGKLRDVTVTLLNEDGDNSLISKKNSEEKMKKLGASFIELSNREKEELGISCGIKIVNLQNGKLKSLGIKEGMVISRLNNRPICSVEEFKLLLGEEQEGLLMELVISRHRKEYIGFGL
jgi:Do/DeqQ family serine protease